MGNSEQMGGLSATTRSCIVEGVNVAAFPFKKALSLATLWYEILAAYPAAAILGHSCSARANHFQGLRGVPIFGVKRERFA
jgi:hypothetical protein